MKRIKMSQANAMMNTIAEKSCNLVGFAEVCKNEGAFFEEVNNKTRETFVIICEILGIEEVEAE